MNVIVLGAGLIGKHMAIDLAKDSSLKVTLADISQNALDALNIPAITKKQADLSVKANVQQLIATSDLVLCALPGFMGFETMKAILESKKNVVDISFFPEDPFLLDELAKKNGVTAIVDCGVAPGMSNILIGYLAEKLDEVDTVLTYVGGLPQLREWPYEYKAVFSPIDVIEEYTRPARYIENNVEVIRTALTDAELINFPGIGTLEAFNTDGVRSLAKTIKAKNIKEKTLRYPGHIDKMAVLRETGFFSKEPIEINGTKISPLEFTAKLLFPKWKMKENDVDITIMEVIVDGTKDGKYAKHRYYLLDYFDTTTKTHSMAKTTGYTATSMVRAFAKGLYTEKGIIVPEYLGKNAACVEHILKELEERGVKYIYSQE